MSFFNKGGDGYLGVDLGSTSLKIVELKNEHGRPKLVTYGYAEQPSGILTQDTPESKTRIVKTLHLIMEKARIKSKKIVAALPSYTVFSSLLTLPEMSKKELESAVQWEAKKFVPLPLEEMALDWKVVEGLEQFNNQTAAPKTDKSQGVIQTAQKKQLKILITAAPKHLVQKYLEIFKMAQMELVGLETENFALERALVGNDKAPVMLIDIGANATNITVVVASVPLISRSVDLGGDSLTKNLAQSLNVDLSRAEQFKRDFGLLLEQNQEKQQLPGRLENIVNSLINEINYVLELYRAQTNIPLEKIVLAGGSAWLPNLPEYLSRALQTKVFIGDPWGRVIYPQELKPVLREIGPALAVSVGLAMREIV